MVEAVTGAGKVFSGPVSYKSGILIAIRVCNNPIEEERLVLPA